jgi:hypothetical protein
MPPVREVRIVLLVVLVGDAEDVSCRKTARKGSPRQPNDSQDESQMRLIRRFTTIGNRSLVVSMRPGQNWTKERSSRNGKCALKRRKELRGGADAAQSSTDDQHVALDGFVLRRAVLELLDQ